MALVTADHLSKRYRLERGGGPPLLPSIWAKLRGRAETRSRAIREVWALDDVSFAVEPGSIVGVIGANGAGKTTLLKILGRVTLPTSGRVVGRGRVVSLLALGSGFQPDLTGRENIYLQAALYGVGTNEVRKNFDGIAEFAELGDFLDVPVRRYSSGMYIRLAFSAAIHMNGDILLADEVLAVGDLAFQERCLRRVEEAGTSGMTVFFVSHDMAAIRRLCDRVIWLDSGRVLADGDADSVVSRYESQARAPGKARAGAVANEHAEILATRLLGSDGSEVGAVRVTDETTLEMVLNVRTVGVELRCAFAVTAGGVLAFRTTQPTPYQAAATGTYCFRARIPAHLLSDTTYRVKAGVGLLCEGNETVLVRDEAVVFTVYAPEDGLLLWDDYRERAGLVSPKLEWQVVEERRSVFA